MRISDWSSDVCSSDLSCGTGRYRQVTCLASGMRRIDRRLPCVRLNIPEIPRSSIMPRNPSIKSPWAARDRVAEREAKREAVLQTAARAFAENGYHRTSLEEIAARLGVSKPTIYYYAQNKDDLVAAIAARALDEIVAAMDADEQSSALSQLSHLLRRYAEIMKIGRAHV